jgi:hypothetical protein
LSENTSETTNEPVEAAESEGNSPTADQIAEWREAAQNVEEMKRRLQADYTRKTQSVADQRRELEAMKAELELARSQANHKDPADWSQINEYVPGLGDTLASVTRELAELKQTTGQLYSGNKATLEAMARDDAWNEALRPFVDDKSANLDEIKAFCEDRNLGPENADLAYRALHGERLGREAILKANRNANAQPPMKGGSVGIQGSVPQEVARPRASDVSKMSWQEIRNSARNDPRRPKR